MGSLCGFRHIIYMCHEGRRAVQHILLDDKGDCQIYICGRGTACVRVMCHEEKALKLVAEDNGVVGHKLGWKSTFPIRVPGT